jgi:predicted MFS family arabinose efflux permease
MTNLNSGNSRGYEYRIVALIFLAWGFIYLDRQALSYIVPALVEDLQLTNGQVGQINMWQTIGYAIAGPLIGILSDKTGKRKSLLIAAILATTLFSALSALANSYMALIIVRFLVGASEGPILPLAMTMIAAASSPGKFGRNAGIVNAGIAIIAITIGPFLVTQLIAQTNWHWAFVIISIPSLLLGLLIWKFTSEVILEPSNRHSKEMRRTKIFELLKYRNVTVSLFISIFCMAGLWIFNAFVPLYLTSAGQLSMEKMGMVMSIMGIFGIVTTIGIPVFSDHFGRKRALILFAFLGVLAPLGLYLFPLGIAGLVMLILFGGMLGSIAPIYMNIIPQESLPIHLSATSSALIIGVGEIIGSFILAGAGNLADSQGLPVVMIIAAASALLVALFGFGLRETNPKLTNKVVQSVVFEENLAEK